MERFEGGVTALHLSAQHFAEVLTALRSSSVGGGHERRQVTRIEVQAPIQISIVTDGKLAGDSTVLTRDVSIGGMGIMYTRQLPAGQQLVARLPRANRKPPLVLLCRVTHCRQLADGIYGVGIAFVQLLEHDDQAAQIDHVRRSILA